MCVHTLIRKFCRTPETPVKPDEQGSPSQSDANSNATGDVTPTGDQAPAGDQAPTANGKSNASDKRLPNTGAASIAGAIVAGIASVGGCYWCYRQW